MTLGYRIYCAGCGEQLPFERVLSQRLEDGGIRSIVEEVGFLCAPCKERGGARQPEPFELTREELSQRRAEKGIELPQERGSDERQPAGNVRPAVPRARSFRRPW